MEPLKEVRLERVYDAPLTKVWEAWTNPELLKQWWGPANVSIPECQVDVRVGGSFYIVMEAGEAMGAYKGTKWPMNATFTTIESHSKIVYTAKAWTEGLKDSTTIDQTTEITFTEENGKTTVLVIATIHSVGPDAQMAPKGMEQGFTQQLEKLHMFLSKTN